VVPVEDSESLDGRVRLLAGRPRGANVRPAGGDLRAGQQVFAAGLRLTPPRIGVLASLGVSPTVRRRPVAAVFSTGDEVVPPDTERLAPGLIRDSNRPMLCELLADAGCEVRDLGIVGDDDRLLRSALAEAAAAADIIVSSGGVSMGEYDLVKHVLRDLGSVEFWRVAMKPGKPFAFGNVAGVPFFGLPGNPVSVFVSFEQFVRPAVLTMMGADAVFRSRVPGVAVAAMPHDRERLTFVRTSLTVSADGRFEAEPVQGQGSHMLAALAAADALAVIPAGAEIGPGDSVLLEMIGWPAGRSAREALQ
jgi:molybdenum cofactor synthesis domain-containing protein